MKNKIDDILVQDFSLSIFGSFLIAGLDTLYKLCKALGTPELLLTKQHYAIMKKDLMDEVLSNRLFFGLII